tara:strand:- start:77 stop:520 length:444 start_codon:yes stop_codon:yes gene_type:complete
MNYILKEPKTKIDFKNYYYFRWQQLRKPLNDSKESAIDEIENESHHIMAVNSDNKIIGVGRLHRKDVDIFQIRFMAVHDSYQNKGIGSEILSYLEKIVVNKNGDSKIILHAREAAINFYKKNGYKIVKKTHKIKGDIQHYLMEKVAT